MSAGNAAMEGQADMEIRATGGHAPDVFRHGAWVPMREYAETEEVDFVIVGTGAGGGTLACKLAESGFSVVALDAGAYWRPLEDFASDEHEQSKLYWTDERICEGDNPIELGANNSGQIGRRLDGPLCDGFPALPARMVQIAHDPRLWRQLAARLARDVALLRRGRGGAGKSPARSPIRGDRSARAILTGRIRSTPPPAVLAARLRGTRHRLDGNPARHRGRRRAASRRRVSIAASAP